MKPGDEPSRTQSTPTGSSLRRGLEKVVGFLTVDIWTGEHLKISRYRGAFHRFLRVLSLASQRFFSDRCLFHASALTFITILSLVPLLAVGFSVAKGFGAYETLLEQVIEPNLDRYVGAATPAAGAEATEEEAATEEKAAAAEAELEPEPLAAAVEEGAETGEEEASAAASTEAAEPQNPALRDGIDQVLAFVRDTDVSKLGTFALALMLFTVVKLLTAVERSFNEIWGVRQPRTFLRKISDYITLVILTPVFLLTATGVMASNRLEFLNDLGIDPLVRWLAPLATLIVIWAGFCFIYLTIPNTKLKFSSALVGGIVGGGLWQLTQVLHLKFQIGTAQYSALYSGFAAFPILLMWIYASWVVVLLGAEVAFAHEHEHSYRGLAMFKRPDAAMRENMAVRAMVRIGQRFAGGRTPWTAEALARELGVPLNAFYEVLESLVVAGILATTSSNEGLRYLPRMDIGRITLVSIIQALRRTPGLRPLTARFAVDGYVDELFEQIRTDLVDSPANKTLREMVERADRLEQEPRVDPSVQPKAREAHS